MNKAQRLAVIMKANTQVMDGIVNQVQGAIRTNLLFKKLTIPNIIIPQAAYDTAFGHVRLRFEKLGRDLYAPIERLHHEDPFISLCLKACLDDDFEAIEGLVTSLCLANAQYLSFTERGRILESGRIDRIQAQQIAQSAVSMWLKDSSGGFGDYDWEWLVTTDSTERKQVLVKEIRRWCRRELLAEESEHHGERPLLGIEEGIYGASVQYQKKGRWDWQEQYLSTEDDLRFLEEAQGDDPLVIALQKRGINPEDLTRTDWENLRKATAIIETEESLSKAHNILPSKEYERLRKGLHRFGLRHSL